MFDGAEGAGVIMNGDGGHDCVRVGLEEVDGLLGVEAEPRRIKGAGFEQVAVTDAEDGQGVAGLVLLLDAGEGGGERGDGLVAGREGEG